MLRLASAHELSSEVILRSSAVVADSSELDQKPPVRATGAFVSVGMSPSTQIILSAKAFLFP